MNGYRVGDTINIRKPAQFEIREGAVAAPQDVVEGKMPLVVDTQAGVDFQFTSKDLTLNIKDLSSAGDEARDGSLGELRRSEVDGPLCKRPRHGSALRARRSTPSLISPLAFSAWMTRPSRRMTVLRAFSRRLLGPAWLTDGAVHSGCGQRVLTVKARSA